MFSQNVFINDEGWGGGGVGGAESARTMSRIFENIPLRLELQKIASFPKIFYGTVSFNKVVFSINVFLWQPVSEWHVNWPFPEMFMNFPPKLNLPIIFSVKLWTCIIMRFSSRNDFSWYLSYILLSFGIQNVFSELWWTFLSLASKWGDVLSVSGFKFIVGEATKATTTTTALC